MTPATLVVGVGREEAIRYMCMFAGRRLLGVIESCGEVELIFDGPYPNLLTVYADDPRGDLLGGRFDVGGVMDPEEYAGADG